MIELSPVHCRILGTLIEKAHTTGSSQYPMSLNGLTTACNQKSNRDPVTDYSDDLVQDNLDQLRERNIVVAVSTPSSRVWKYKHNLREVLGVGTHDLAVLAELMLRGPQTLGELRTRASRIATFESLDIVRNVLEHLMTREEPLVRRVAPAPGSRAERYAQLLCPGLHAIVEGPADAAGAGQPVAVSEAAALMAADTADLTARIEALEARVDELTSQLRRLADSLGEALN